jgi:hypothetical protein
MVYRGISPRFMGISMGKWASAAELIEEKRAMSGCG